MKFVSPSETDETDEAQLVCLVEDLPLSEADATAILLRAKGTRVRVRFPRGYVDSWCAGGGAGFLSALRRFAGIGSSGTKESAGRDLQLAREAGALELASYSAADRAADAVARQKAEEAAEAAKLEVQAQAKKKPAA